MQFSKKAKASLIIGALVLSVTTVYAASAATSVNTTSFKDVPKSHPFSASVVQLKAKGLVKGYGDGNFKPDNSVSRAEFITMVMASIDKNNKGSNCFSDVKDEWFAPFICNAKAKGLVSGYSDGTFKPFNNINFAESSAIMAKAHKLNPSAAKSGEAWFKPAVVKLETKAAIPTSIDYLDKKISRAETAEIIFRLTENNDDKPTKTYASLTAPVPTIGSCPELQEKVEAYYYKLNRPYGGAYNKALMLERSSTTSDDDDDGDDGDADSSAPPASPQASQGLGGGEREDSDFSSTNVQVAGVDEADIIKNDGGYIYMVSGSTVRIVDAAPPADMKQVAKIEVSDKNFRPTDMYVTGDTLVILGTSFENYGQPIPLDVPADAPQSKMIAPSIWPGPYSSRTKTYILDIKDRSNPKEVRSLEFDGNMNSSRRIGNRLYMVLNNYPNIYTIMEKDEPIEKILPKFKDSRTGKEEAMAKCADIRYLPRYEELNFLTVASVDISNSSSTVQKETIMGSGGTVYASPESLYIATTRYSYPEVGVFDIWAPPLGKETTSLFRFSLQSNGEVKYASKGEVQGHLLNQFSMDESADAFRVATTTGQVWNGSSNNPSKNHLIILDRNNLETTLGKIENIAPGETIYSVRFLGKRAYMVTFKKIDPFFVIDVENPRAPKILGELKIPGYSDYLHPYDENHIIGFGKEAVDPTELERGGFGRNPDFDFAWYQGMKIALFDVTDVANPKVLHKELIGDRGTESEVLHNHKALLYDKARNLFAFPVTVHEIANKTGKSGSEYGVPVFQGAYIYTLDLEKGFTLKGRVTHSKPEDFANTYYSGYNSMISRIVSIGEHLYTISLDKIKAIKRDDISEVKSIDLEVEKNTYDYRIME